MFTIIIDYDFLTDPDFVMVKAQSDNDKKAILSKAIHFFIDKEDRRLTGIISIDNLEFTF